jgi:hypothetical protein
MTSGLQEKNFVKRGCRCKNVDAYETNAHHRRILVTPFRTNAGDIFDIYLSNLTNTLDLHVMFDFSQILRGVKNVAWQFFINCFKR